eukprot:COSAG05_NODE_1368_length_5060_cov_5.437412_2_plen_222_part_00
MALYLRYTYGVRCACRYQLIGTWGYSPKPAHWLRFTAWAREFAASGLRPYVAGTYPGLWYKEFEATGRCPGPRCFWEIYHIKYTTLFPDRWTVYYKAPRSTTLAANWQEAGLHYAAQRGPPKSDWPVYRPPQVVAVGPHPPANGSGATHVEVDTPYAYFPALPPVLTWDGTLSEDLQFAGHEQPADQQGGVARDCKKRGGRLLCSKPKQQPEGTDSGDGGR